MAHYECVKATDGEVCGFVGWSRVEMNQHDGLEHAMSDQDITGPAAPLPNAYRELVVHSHDVGYKAFVIEESNDVGITQRRWMIPASVAGLIGANAVWEILRRDYAAETGAS
jgi:hypothetical protein